MKAVSWLRGATWRLVPTTPAGWALATVLALGAVLRVEAMLAWWPTIPTNGDSQPYASYAATDALGDPQHPAGVSLLLALIGLITRDVGVYTVLQHLLGIATAVILFAAVRRASGSSAAGVIAAAFVLLNADQLYVEQEIASEWLFALMLAAALFATVHAGEKSSLRWALAAGGLFGLVVVVRTQGILVPVIAALALGLWRSGPPGPRVRSAATLLLTCAAVLLAYGAVKDAATHSFDVGASPGWQLYARVAPFADCRDFTPPPGTRALCETTPPSERLGDHHYLFDPTSPAIEAFGALGNQDGKVGAWARAAIEAQPGAYLRTAWDILAAYYVPSSLKRQPASGDGLDAELSWETTTPQAQQQGTIRGMWTFFSPFEPRIDAGDARALYDYQRGFRFGAPLLWITTILTVLGLIVGDRRTRVLMLLFGVGGFVLLLPQAFGGAYIGRYSVPMAGPMGAAAAIALGRLLTLRRDRSRRGTPAAPEVSRAP